MKNKVYNLFRLDKLTNALKSQIRTITTAAMLISFMGLVSRILGLLRDRLLAGTFGAGIELDMYYAAFRIPDLMYNLLVLGALSAGFIPIFSKFLSFEKDDIQAGKKGWELVNDLLHTIIISIGLVSILLYFFTPQLTTLLVPGFGAAEQATTVELTRIMLLSPILLSVSSIFGGILQSFRRFLVYALAPVMYNVGIILGVLYLYPSFGLAGVAWGVILGAFLHLLVQVPTVFHLGYRYAFSMDIVSKQMREIGRMMLPRTFSLAIVQINLIIVTTIASTLAAGSLAVFNLANNLQSVPLGLFGIPFAIAAFPTLSKHAANDDMREFGKTFGNITKQILFFLIPVSVLFIVLRAQIVRVILGAGVFDWNDTILTFNAVGLFAVSMFAQSLLPLFTRAFYALSDAKTPFYISLVMLFLNAGLSIGLAQEYGLYGLVGAFSISSILHIAFTWISLYGKEAACKGHGVGVAAGKMIVASAAMAVFAQATKIYYGSIVSIDTLPGIFIQMALVTAIGGIAYLAVGRLLNLSEVTDFLLSVNRRFLKRFQFTSEKFGE
jgi:putative peptidoglycan lipid II flippase